MLPIVVTVLRYVLSAVIAVACIIMTVPKLRSLLQFGLLHGPDLAIAIGAAVLLLLLLEASKVIEPRCPSGDART